MTDGLFDDTAGDPGTPSGDVNYLETLVGEGKKFQTVDDLARGKVEADKFIETLKEEQARLRKDLETRITLEEFLERQNAKPSTDAGAAPKVPSTEDQGTKLKPEDIQSLIRETLTQEQKKTAAATNLATVKNTLAKEWGSDFSKVLAAKASELEVGTDFLNNLAATNPKAFFKMVGVEGAKKDTYVPTPTSTVEAPKATGSFRTLKDYESLRKSDPRTYWSPRVQNEILKKTEMYGDDFLKG